MARLSLIKNMCYPCSAVLVVGFSAVHVMVSSMRTEWMDRPSFYTCAEYNPGNVYYIINLICTCVHLCVVSVFSIVRYRILFAQEAACPTCIRQWANNPAWFHFLICTTLVGLSMWSTILMRRCTCDLEPLNLEPEACQARFKLWELFIILQFIGLVIHGVSICILMVLDAQFLNESGTDYAVTMVQRIPPRPPRVPSFTRTI